MAIRDPAASASRHITKPRLLILLSLALTWYIASLLPAYTPRLRSTLTTHLTTARQKLPTLKVNWSPTPRFPPQKLALLIEPRPLPHQAPHLLHMMAVVPPTWRFLFIGSEASVLGLSRAPAIQERVASGKLELLVLPPPWSVESRELVYRTMTDLRFYDEFLGGVEWVLKFESDSILCANSGESLDEWLHWSWAGAPRKKNDRFAGNGGLTLRRLSAIRRILSFQTRRNDTEPEDEWFGKRLWVLPGERVASAADGGLAVEDVWAERPMGYHVRGGGEKLSGWWGDEGKRRGVLEYCPEVGLIMEMKLVVEGCEGEGGGKEEAKNEGEAKKKEGDDKEKQGGEGGGGKKQDGDGEGKDKGDPGKDSPGKDDKAGGQ